MSPVLDDPTLSAPKNRINSVKLLVAYEHLTDNIGIIYSSRQPVQFGFDTYHTMIGLMICDPQGRYACGFGVPGFGSLPRESDPASNS